MLIFIKILQIYLTYTERIVTLKRGLYVFSLFYFVSLRRAEVLGVELSTVKEISSK